MSSETFYIFKDHLLPNSSVPRVPTRLSRTRGSSLWTLMHLCLGFLHSPYGQLVASKPRETAESVSKESAQTSR